MSMPALKILTKRGCCGFPVPDPSCRVLLPEFPAASPVCRMLLPNCWCLAQPAEMDVELVGT
jgi:hypothetical protein